MAKITLKKTVSDFSSQRQSYDMLVEVTEAVGVSDKIFVWKSNLPAVPPTPGVGLKEMPPVFISVADPVDLEEFPEDTPQMPDNPYFRTKSALLRFRSVLDLEETWQYINTDVKGLVDAINTGVTGGSTETVVIS